MTTEKVPVSLYRWSKSNFPPASVGEHLVPDFIEGRLRPQATIDLPLQRLAGREYLRRLETLGAKTLGELLKTPQADFEASLHHPRLSGSVEFWIQEHLTDVALGPEGLLLYSIFGTDPEPDIKRPIRVEVEQVRAETVRKALGTLTPQEAKVTDLFFGITTGVRKPVLEIAKQLNLPRPNIPLELARRKLSHPSRSSLLRPFHAFRENALGRAVFGVSCGYEFQQKLEDPNVARITLADLVVSQDFKQAVLEQGGSWERRSRFMFDLLQLPVSVFSAEMLEELQQEFQSFLR